MFKFNCINNKKILVSDIFPTNKIMHLFTTRESVLTCRDMPELDTTSQNNRSCLAEYLGIEQKNIISPVQTHSDHISIAYPNEVYPDTDALITDRNDIAILLNFADCTPIILYDEAKNIGAVVHAGWKGTAAQIVQKTVIKMVDEYNSKPANITAAIGPAISAKNYQVDEPVFLKLQQTIKNNYKDYYTFDKKKQKYNVDLKTINQYQLEELGIKRIDKCQYCTYDSVDVFFSYRKEQGKTARHSAVLKLLY